MTATLNPKTGRYLAFDDGRGFRLEELGPINRIGSGFRSTIRIERPGVAARHAVVAVRPDGKVELRDDRSETGTWVNGERVGRRVLEPGDELTVGGIVLAFVATPELSRADVVDLDTRRHANASRAARRYRRALAAAAAAILIAGAPSGAVAGGNDDPTQVERPA
jgi:hypothetical protein